MLLTYIVLVKPSDPYFCPLGTTVVVSSGSVTAHQECGGQTTSKKGQYEHYCIMWIYLFIP